MSAGADVAVRPPAGRLARDLLALVALAVSVLLVIAVTRDASPSARVPLSIALVTLVPGVAFVGFADIDVSATWAALIVAVSLSTSMILSAALAWAGWLRPEPTAAAFALLCCPPLLAQLVRRRS